MANIAPLGIYRAFDDNGNPLAGGKLYTYESGTTTPKATYTTAAGDIENDNPVELDASGYANVWLGDGGYKFILKDANDVVQFTVDNIGGASDTAFGGTINDLDSNTLITNIYANSINNCDGNITLTLLPAASAGEGFYFVVKNIGSGTVTIDPDGSEVTDISTFGPGGGGIIYCDGIRWRTLEFLMSNLPVNRGGTGATTPAAARTNLGVDVDYISGLIEVPGNVDYMIVVKVPVGGTITNTITKCVSGTATFTFKINTTALGGSANAVSTAEVDQSHASNNVFISGDDLVITVSANSSCSLASFTIRYTKN